MGSTQQNKLIENTFVSYIRIASRNNDAINLKLAHDHHDDHLVLFYSQFI